jgi:hypothetical protein
MTQATNAFANYYEAQMEATAGVVQAALSGMQRLQEITLRAMREGAGEQFALARTLSEARDPSDFSRMQSGFAPATENVRRFQAELLQAITEANADIVRASYSMMERLRDTLAESSGAMRVGTPFEGGGGSSLAVYETGLKQWQAAMQQLMPGMPGFGATEPETGGAAPARSKPAKKSAAAKRGRRR